LNSLKLFIGALRCASLAFGLLLFLSCKAQAAIEVHQFANDTERDRYQSLIDEMRCPKCQNQNLAGSDSPIAADLREEIYRQIKDGKSDKEIIDYLVARYGEFILYRPQLTPHTLLLWSLPVILLVLGGGVLTLVVRRRRRLSAQEAGELTAGERARLAELMKLAGSASNTRSQAADSARKAGE